MNRLLQIIDEALRILERVLDSNEETTETSPIASSWTLGAGSNIESRVLHGKPRTISDKQHTGLSNNEKDIETCKTLTNIDLVSIYI